MCDEILKDTHLNEATLQETFILDSGVPVLFVQFCFRCFR